MDFTLSPRAQEMSERMWDFMREKVFPAEPVWHAYLAEHGPHATPPVIEDLKTEARRRGLWNLFLPKLSGMRPSSCSPLPSSARSGSSRSWRAGSARRSQ